MLLAPVQFVVNVWSIYFIYPSALKTNKWQWCAGGKHLVRPALPLAPPLWYNPLISKLKCTSIFTTATI